MIKPRGFKLQRLGMVIQPEPGNPHEVEGILNPAAVAKMGSKKGYWIISPVVADLWGSVPGIDLIHGQKFHRCDA
jgi:hypothetical protein